MTLKNKILVILAIFPLLIFCVFSCKAPSKELASEIKNEGAKPLKSVTVKLLKMNVFYIGVDNPISIRGLGAKLEDMTMSCSGGGCNMKKVSDGMYNITVTSVGEARIGIYDGKGFSETFKFSVKRIPDPLALLIMNKGIDGKISAGEFRAKQGIIAHVANFDFDVKCKIQAYELTRITQNGKRTKSLNRDDRYTEESVGLVDKASPGDIYIYTNIKAKCPGDVANRQINSMVWEIQ